MSRRTMCLLKINNANAVTSIRRHLSFRRAKDMFENYLKSDSNPPYSHICQVGEPALRAPTEPVDPRIIPMPAFQRVVKHMTNVMRTYGAVGLSATQVGLNYQIFLIEVTQKHLKAFSEQEQKTKQVELIPLKVFINPKMKVVDYTMIKYTEECMSVLGYSAIVPRMKTVRIEALNLSGEPFTWTADGWSARIAQHEMDHLQGKLYVDRMDTTTFCFNSWKHINTSKGLTKMQFYPKSWLRYYF